MAPARQMILTLTEDLDRFVREEVERGVSASSSDYVRELLEKQYLERRAAVLDDAIDRGVADADAGRSMPAEEAFRRLKDTLGLPASR